MARVFVGVWPPDAVVEALAALPRPDIDGVRWVPRDNLHVTLRFLGDVPAEHAADQVVGRLVDAALPAAAAEVGPAVAMLGHRVLMVPVAGLDALATAVVAATADLGRPPPGRPFVGHITLARCRDDRACRRACGATCGAAADTVFPVREIAVVSSETRPEGARYTTVATVPAG